MTDPPPPLALARRMKVTGALLLTLSAVTPAASVYVVIPGILVQAGSGAFLALAAGALVGLAVAFVYAELSSAHPLAGGEYCLIGRTLGTPVGFTYLAMNAIASGFGVPVLSLGASTYLAAVWPGLPNIPVAVGMIGFATLLGLLNIRTNALVTGAFLAVELVLLAVLATLGFAHPSRGLEALAIHPQMLAPSGILTTAPVVAIGLATTVAIFAYNGFGAAVYFSEEMVGAPARVARTIILALLVTVAFEFIPTAAVLLGAPDLRSLLASANPFGDFVLQRGGRALSTVVSLGVALAIVNAVIAIVLVYARFFYATGRDRAWPAPVNAALTRLHPRFHSPWVATLLAGGMAMAGCFLPFQLLLVLNGTAVVATYALLCVAAIVGRRNGTTGMRAYHMPLFPLAPVLGLGALAYVVYADWIDVSVGRPSLIATAAMLAVGAIYALAMRRARGPGWTIAGPAEEAE
ncbi:MAG TPA: APC family permease [Caulobacteraceae bacterium]|nr:APC family permease [Caulobacteraceae bacterium]